MNKYDNFNDRRKNMPKIYLKKLNSARFDYFEPLHSKNKFSKNFCSQKIVTLRYQNCEQDN